MAGPVFDPATSAPMALAGRVVTMDATRSVVDDGVVYLRDGAIAAIRAPADPPPSGFEAVPVVTTKGTMFPGMIELHNHLPYGVLQLWQVPKRYSNRDQWSSPSTPDYRRLISGPMGVIGRNADAVPAVVRYVEVRCLLGGTTTSQGVALASNAGIVKHFRGLVRNVESTGDPDLPAAATHIADVDATDAEHFLARISGQQKLILHLAEGTQTSARQHFQALRVKPDTWAITENLIGIHCVGLSPEDFAIFGGHGGSMVWSPLSNLLLYGETASLGAALDHGVPVALGSDWSPSGSKNLLGELKTARLTAPLAGAPGLSGADLVAMATITPARMLGWGSHLGSLEVGKKADLIVVDAVTADPYDALINATEKTVTLVVVNGVPRSGTVRLMTALGVAGGERITIRGQTRVLNLAQNGADPDVAQVSAATAMSTLTEALADLGRPTGPALRRAFAPSDGRLRLAVSGVIDNHMSARPHLPFHGHLTGPNPPDHRRPLRLAAPPGPFPSLTLDPLTAADNPGYYATLRAETNVPEPVRTGLVKHAPRPSQVASP
jgi:5-methylthioadenosine/S-adenosylhomocysteine deaminase